jgi:hypothetical protein
MGIGRVEMANFLLRHLAVTERHAILGLGDATAARSTPTRGA